MSQWTHVNAAIRFDGLPGISKQPNLGTTVDYKDAQEIWEACDVPCGSEGSLKFKVTVVGEGLVWVNAHIWGDLRDYDNEQEIILYLERICKGQHVRSGIAEIGIEYQHTTIYRYEPDTGVWILAYRKHMTKDAA